MEWKVVSLYFFAKGFVFILMSVCVRCLYLKIILFTIFVSLLFLKFLSFCNSFSPPNRSDFHSSLSFKPSVQFYIQDFVHPSDQHPYHITHTLQSRLVAFFSMSLFLFQTNQFENHFITVFSISSGTTINLWPPLYFFPLFIYP